MDKVRKLIFLKFSIRYEKVAAMIIKLNAERGVKLEGKMEKKFEKKFEKSSKKRLIKVRKKIEKIYNF